MDLHSARWILSVLPPRITARGERVLPFLPINVD